MRSILWGLILGEILITAVSAETITLNPVKDTSIYEQEGKSNGDGSFLFAGRTNELTTPGRRALLAFDVASSIPAGSTIHSASVTLSLSKTSNDDPFDFSFHRVLKNWGEGSSNATGSEGMGANATPGDATWSLAVVPDQPWANLGGDFVETPSLTASVTGVGDFTWASTPISVSDVQSWLDNAAENFGWILIGNETVAQSARRFDSRESTTAETRPKLTIDFTRSPGLAGDFDGNGSLDSADIDALTSEVLSATHQAKFDLNQDQLVNEADRQVWVVDLRKTFLGDSNLDGEFTSGDFVSVFSAGQYEDGVADNSTWATGDWNGDREFDTSDFVAAFQGGGYEMGPRPVVAVPEPTNLGLLCLALIGVVCKTKTRKFELDRRN